MIARKSREEKFKQFAILFEPDWGGESRIKSSKLIREVLPAC
jgi:hypothetical protein